MLLWIDRTIGLAHCYESDKCQPGRMWYARSLAFHHWLSQSFGSSPLELGQRLDWLFQRALKDYLKQRAAGRLAEHEKGVAQRAIYGDLRFPLPGADPEVERLISEILGPYFASPPSPEVLDHVGERLRDYWKEENKRKNLLGEGFEDVLAAIVGVVCPNQPRARTRLSIAEVDGFHSLGAKDKATKVDLVIDHTEWTRPALVNVKWSIRADREDQLWDDFKEYVRFDRDQGGFDHVLVTNEFDPARLNAVCDRRESNNFVFKNVVHINTAGLLAAYSPLGGSESEVEPIGSAKPASSIQKVREQVANKRLISLGDWLAELGSNPK